MKVLLVCPYDPDRHGGVQRNIHALAAALAGRGHEARVVAPGAGAPPQAGIMRLGRMRSVAFAGTRFELTWASRKELSLAVDEIHRWRPDLVNYHTLWDPLMPFQLFQRLPFPAVATFHDTPPPGVTGSLLRTLFKVLSHHLLQRVDGAIAVSPAPMAHLRPGASGVRPVILPPVTDLSAFFAVQKKVTSQPQVLFIGRLEPRKGVPVLLQAISMLADGRVALPRDVPPPRFIIAGDGDLRGAVIAMQKQLGRQWISFVPVPSLTDQLELMAGATLAVSPALYGESFGIVLAEALASGTPIIGADNEGYRSVLTGAGRALLTPAGDAGALAVRISSLLGNAGETASLASWGRNHARQFDAAERIAEFEQVFTDAIAHHARSKLEG